MTKIFFSYSHADEVYRDTLEKHLAALKHQGFIETWHDRRILPGNPVDGNISKNLENSEIILLLVSADFIASPYCYNIEMARAIERHEEGSARVIPVILRHRLWHDMPFGKLLATPKDGKPINTWPDLDEAFVDVVKAIKSAINAQSSKMQPQKPIPIILPEEISELTELANIEIIRSSNLRIRKEFSDIDYDNFLDLTFEHVKQYFQNSLEELKTRNPELNFRFREIDSNKFTTTIYKNGESISSCKIRLGGMFGNSINYSTNADANDNSCNESVSVEHDDQNMFLKPMGLPLSGIRMSKMTKEGTAEYFWSLFIEQLQ